MTAVKRPARNVSFDCHRSVFYFIFCRYTLRHSRCFKDFIRMNANTVEDILREIRLSERVVNILENGENRRNQIRT